MGDLVAVTGAAGRWSGSVHRSRGLHRWTAWLRARLSPARVEMADPGVLEHGALWKVQFLDGITTRIRVDRRMLAADLEEFEEITSRLEHFGWIGALRASGAQGLHLSRWSAD